MCRSKSVTFVLSQTGIPEIKDTLMQIWKSSSTFGFTIKTIYRRFHIKTPFYILRKAHVRYVKSLFTNIQKQ